MSQLTTQQTELLTALQSAIDNAQTELAKLSEDWRTYKDKLTERERAINEQRTNIAILRQRIAEIDPHYGFSTKGTANE